MLNGVAESDIHWLVVSTPLKNISQLGLLFPIYGKNVSNHQPVVITYCRLWGVALQTKRHIKAHMTQTTRRIDKPENPDSCSKNNNS